MLHGSRTRLARSHIKIRSLTAIALASSHETMEFYCVTAQDFLVLIRKCQYHLLNCVKPLLALVTSASDERPQLNPLSHESAPPEFFALLCFPLHHSVCFISLKYWLCIIPRATFEMSGVVGNESTTMKVWEVLGAWQRVPDG